jgi:hypothetical protein
MCSRIRRSSNKESPSPRNLAHDESGSLLFHASAAVANASSKVTIEGDEMRLSRRDALRLIGLATASGSVWGGALGESAAALNPSLQQDTAVPINTHLFRLSDVTLLESAFRQSHDRNQEYLFSLDPDRLLAWFRREAGLTPKAPVYGGWESEAVAGPNQSLPGAICGFYLSSMANCYGDTRDFANG